MDREFWIDRWATGRIGFHESTVNANLERHFESIEEGPDMRILVPLCGKSVDLLWLAERGHKPVGVELAEVAAKQFFADNDIDFAENETANGHPLYQGGGVDIVVSDFFSITHPDVGVIDAVWDRAALVALPPTKRSVYAQCIRNLTTGPILLSSFSYDQAVMEGPPFSVDQDEIGKLYEGDAITRTSHRDVAAEVSFEGHKTFFSSVYVIRST